MSSQVRAVANHSSAASSTAVCSWRCSAAAAAVAAAAVASHAAASHDGSQVLARLPGCPSPCSSLSGSSAARVTASSSRGTATQHACRKVSAILHACSPPRGCSPTAAANAGPCGSTTTEASSTATSAAVRSCASGAASSYSAGGGGCARQAGAGSLGVNGAREGIPPLMAA